jgi:hypothetical protein
MGRVSIARSIGFKTKILLMASCSERQASGFGRDEC